MDAITRICDIKKAFEYAVSGQGGLDPQFSIVRGDLPADDLIGENHRTFYQPGFDLIEMALNPYVYAYASCWSRDKRFSMPASMSMVADHST